MSEYERLKAQTAQILREQLRRGAQKAWAALPSAAQEALDEDGAGWESPRWLRACESVFEERR